MKLKTAKDVTLEEWIRLAKSVELLLDLSMLAYWENHYEVAADSSFSNAIDDTVTALTNVGMAHVGKKQFIANLEKILTDPEWHLPLIPLRREN